MLVVNNDDVRAHCQHRPACDHIHTALQERRTPGPRALYELLDGDTMRRVELKALRLAAAREGATGPPSTGRKSETRRY
jgi:hypothetical protein